MPVLRKPDGFEHQKLLVLSEQRLKEAASHPLIESLYVTDIGFFPQAQFHYRERTVGCEATIFIYCVEGEGWATIGNLQQMQIYPQTLLVIPASIPHSYGASFENPWSIYWFHLRGSAVDAFVQNLMLTDYTLHIPSTETASLVTLFEQCYETLFYRGDSLKHHLFVSQVMRHLLSICALLHPTSIQDVKKREYVERATYYMMQHLESSLTLDELAQAVHVSRSHLVYMFKEVIGSSPIDYYLRLKMQRACQYLVLTDQSIKEVARSIGFHDPYYFSRLFRKIIQQSPSEYRKRKKG